MEKNDVRAIPFLLGKHVNDSFYFFYWNVIAYIYIYIYRSLTDFRSFKCIYFINYVKIPNSYSIHLSTNTIILIKNYVMSIIILTFTFLNYQSRFYINWIFYRTIQRRFWRWLMGVSGWSGRYLTLNNIFFL